MPRIMVFGTFDRLHGGHRSFLTEARSLGGELIAVVARDEVVMRLKGHIPAESERERLRILENSRLADRVILSDRLEGEYGVVQELKPDIIAVGYDQEGLEKDLRRAMTSGRIPEIKIARMKPLDPDRLHSSLLDPA